MRSIKNSFKGKCDIKHSLIGLKMRSLSNLLFSKIKQDKRLRLFFIFLSILSLLTLSFSCRPFSSTTNRSYDFFIVVAPLNKTQADLAYSFLEKVKSEMLFVDSHYEIRGVCKKNQKVYIDSKKFYKESSPEMIITNEAFRWINNPISEGNSQPQNISKDIIYSKCDALAGDTLGSIVDTLKDYLKQKRGRNMLVFLQLPWEKGIDMKTYNNLKRKFVGFDDWNRIKKVYIFGVSPTGSKIVDVFGEIGNVELTGSDNVGLDNIFASVKNFLEKLPNP